MSLIVQKYGGSSVADIEKINNVAKRVARTRDEGHDVVVVVSAMRGTTDNLINLAYEVNEHPPERDLDTLLATGEIVASTMVSLALNHFGCQAINFTGAQAGIQTDASYGKARILSINTSRVLQKLSEGYVVVVAGFQGITPENNVSTLGRGGSDTTAVALAISLMADECQIYTDVDGVYTADPRLIDEARKLQDICYEEMLELAGYGTKVMHIRSVELGELYDMPIYVSSSFNNNSGTKICKEVIVEVRNKVRAIAHDTNIAQVTVVEAPDTLSVAADILEPLARANINVMVVSQSVSINKRINLTFTVARNELSKVRSIVEPVAQELGCKKCVFDDTIAKVSIVGTGMQNAPGYAAKMFRTLCDNGIDIKLITTSEIRITCSIPETTVRDAVRVLHQAFEMEKEI